MLCRVRPLVRLAPSTRVASCRLPVRSLHVGTAQPANAMQSCRSSLRQLCTKPTEAGAGAAKGATAGAAAGAAAGANAAEASATVTVGAGATAAAASEAVAEPLFVASDWLHFGAATATFYFVNDALYKAFAAAEIKFPASLVGMFGILGGLWGLSATGQVATAEKIVAAARPALAWVARYLPLFYVPALVVLPLAVESLSGSELGKIGAVVGLGMPFSLLSAGAIVLGIRKIAAVELLPVPPVPKPPPFTRLHLGACAAVAVGAALALTLQGEGSDGAFYAAQLHMLAMTVGGLVFGSIPPAALAPLMPHPVVATTACATLGVAVVGAATGAGYYETLKTYLSKGKEGRPKGCGDHLMSMLGVVVLTFGFHIYGQRALLVRHAAEVIGCAALASLLSMVVTASAGRAIGLVPDLTLALVPRSVTVALAMPIASQLGVQEDGVAICAAAVLVTGLVGAVLCQRLLNAGGLMDPLVRGLATASSCHGFGTAALAATEPAALPFCALAYGLVGIAASLWAAIPQVQTMLKALAGAGAREDGS